MDTDEHRLFNWPQTHTNHYFFMFQQKIGTEQIKHIKYFSLLSLSTKLFHCFFFQDHLRQLVSGYNARFCKGAQSSLFL